MRANGANGYQTRCTEKKAAHAGEGRLTERSVSSVVFQLKLLKAGAQNGYQSCGGGATGHGDGGAGEVQRN